MSGYGGRAAFGWRYDDTKRLVPVPEQQEVLRRIHKLAADGMSPHKISAALAKDGVKLSHVTIRKIIVGRRLREAQSEQRSLRTAQALRQQVSDGIIVLLDRIGQTEALLATRLDLLLQRMDQTERSVQERLDRIETRRTPPA